MKIVLTLWGIKSVWYFMGIQAIKRHHAATGVPIPSNFIKEIAIAVVYPSIFWIALIVVSLVAVGLFEVYFPKQD
jgi:hypothetical protein